MIDGEARFEYVRSRDGRHGVGSASDDGSLVSAEVGFDVRSAY